MGDSPDQTDQEVGPSWSIEVAGRVLAIALNLGFPYVVSIRAIVATVFPLADNDASAEGVGALPLSLSVHRFPSLSLCFIQYSESRVILIVRFETLVMLV